MSMRILIYMPSKNVYVSDADLPLFEAAAALAGGLSTAVATGLRLYVAQEEKRRKGSEMKTVELEVDQDAAIVTKRFMGRKLVKWHEEQGRRMRSFTVFETAKGQLAVYEREEPNWYGIHQREYYEDDAPEQWHHGWWQPTRTLRVFPQVEAMEGELPDQLVAAVRGTIDTPLVEELDI